MLWECCTQYAYNLENSAVATGLKKGQFFIPIPKKDKAEECSNYHTIALISHASKVMLKILQARLQQYVNFQMPDIQARFRKGRRTRDQIANTRWIIEKAREFQKNISGTISALLTMPKPLTVWITTDCGKFFKRWEYQTTWLASWEIYMQVKEQLLEPNMEKDIRSKLGKEYVKAVYCHPVYLTYMPSTSCKMTGWWSTSWNRDFWEKY